MSGQFVYHRLKSAPASPPRRISRPLRLDATAFLRHATPVTYTYTDSPGNRRRRQAAGIEKPAGTSLGIPQELQHLDGRVRLIKEEYLTTLLLACLRSINERVSALENTLRMRRLEDRVTALENARRVFQPGRG